MIGKPVTHKLYFIYILDRDRGKCLFSFLFWVYFRYKNTGDKMQVGVSEIIYGSKLLCFKISSFQYNIFDQNMMDLFLITA
jgi:hypothetical protein